MASLFLDKLDCRSPGYGEDAPCVKRGIGLQGRFLPTETVCLSSGNSDIFPRLGGQVFRTAMEGPVVREMSLKKTLNNAIQQKGGSHVWTASHVGWLPTVVVEHWSLTQQELLRGLHPLGPGL